MNHTERCTRCNDKGYIESPMLFSNGSQGSIRQCCDIRKYSAEVQRRINGVQPLQNQARRLSVIDGGKPKINST